MTDVIYLDEYGNAVDDGTEIHELIDMITDMLANMTKEERLNWFCRMQYPYPIDFKAEIDGTDYYEKSVTVSEYRFKALKLSGRYGMICIPTIRIISGCGKE